MDTVDLGNGTAPTIGPAIKPISHAGVTLAIAIVCTLLTLFIAYQVSKILFGSHRKISFYSACLILALGWGILRCILLFQYQQDPKVTFSDEMYKFLLLFIIPICLQFTMFSLVVLYFTSLVNNALPQPLRNFRNRICQFIWFILNSGYIGSNIGLAVMIFNLKQRRAFNESNANTVSDLSDKRVLVSELLSLCLTLALLGTTIKFRTLVKRNPALEAHGLTLRQLCILTAELFVLYMSRFIYDMIGLTTDDVDTWGYRFTFLTSRNPRNSDDTTFIVFVICLFCWELIPVGVMGWFFHLPKSSSNSEEMTQSLIQPVNVVFDHDVNGSDHEDDDDDNDAMYQRTTPVWHSHGSGIAGVGSGHASNYGSFQSYPYGTSYGSPVGHTMRGAVNSSE